MDFFSMYSVQHCFICCPSDFTVWEDAGIEPSDRIFNQSKGATNRVGKGLSYWSAKLHRLAELIPWNRFLGSLKVSKFGLWTVTTSELAVRSSNHSARSHPQNRRIANQENDEGRFVPLLVPIHMFPFPTPLLLKNRSQYELDATLRCPFYIGICNNSRTSKYYLLYVLYGQNLYLYTY